MKSDVNRLRNLDRVLKVRARFAWDNEGLSSSVIEQGDMTLLWKYTNIIVST